jgi:pyruvate/2-oxoglutarate/acetoin dehydrogenase E1 component
MTTYKDSIKLALHAIGQDPLARFVGYGMIEGRAGGFLKGVNLSQIVEFTVAENLMVGAAMGMSLMGLRPVVTIERADFLYNCMDAIASHLDKCAEISRGEFVPSVILRVVIGNSRKPLFTGATHTSDPSEGMKLLLKMPVVVARDAYEIEHFYAEAYAQMVRGEGSTMIFELKDKY